VWSRPSGSSVSLRFRLVSEIAHHHTGTSYHQFAYLAVRHGSGSIVHIGDAEFAVGDRAADRAVLVPAVERMGRASCNRVRDDVRHFQRSYRAVAVRERLPQTVVVGWV
jgi:hypothetical protein